MARLFDDASSQYLEIDSAVVGDEPLTLACWFNSDNVTARQTAIYVGDKASADKHYWCLVLQGSFAAKPVSAITRGAGGESAATTSTGYSANTWHHACAVFAANNDRAAFIDGGSKATNTGNQNVGTVDRTSLGRLGDATPSGYLSGLLAEAAIWNAALTDDEVALLAKGVSPLLVRPEALVAYWPLIGNYSPEIDRAGGFNLTVTGATKAAHPRIFYPPRARIMTKAGGPPPPASLAYPRRGRRQPLLRFHHHEFLRRSPAAARQPGPLAARTA